LWKLPIGSRSPSQLSLSLSPLQWFAQGDLPDGQIFRIHVKSLQEKYFTYVLKKFRLSKLYSRLDEEGRMANRHQT
jgi:hypothetical protein